MSGVTLPWLVLNSHHWPTYQPTTLQPVTSFLLQRARCALCLHAFAAAGGSQPIGTLQWASGMGVVPLSTYPYLAATSSCSPSFQATKQKVIAGAVAVSLQSANSLYDALQQAPVTITIWADGLNELFLYMGGAGSLFTGANAVRPAAAIQCTP